MINSVLLAFIGAICLVLVSMPANAQATRRWVSGEGDDAKAATVTNGVYRYLITPIGWLQRLIVTGTAALSLFASVIGLAAPANAETFSWSYSGTGFFGTGTDTGSGTLTTGGSAPTCGTPPSCSYVNPPYTTTPGSTITSITGTWNGFTITGLVNPGSFDTNNNVLYLPPNGGLLDASANGEPGGVAFFVHNYTGNNVPTPTDVVVQLYFNTVRAAYVANTGNTSFGCCSLSSAGVFTVTPYGTDYLSFRGQGVILDNPTPTACQNFGINFNTPLFFIYRWTNDPSVANNADALYFISELGSSFQIISTQSPGFSLNGTSAFNYTNEDQYGNLITGTGSSNMTIMAGNNSAVSLATGNMKIVNGQITNFFNISGCNITNLHGAGVATPQ